MPPLATSPDFDPETFSADTPGEPDFRIIDVVILDITDPSEPSFVGRTDFAADEEGNAHSAWLARNERLLIQTDEDFSPEASPGIEQAWGYPRFFDIRDPAHPVLLSTFKLPSTTALPPPFPGFFSVHDPKVQGNLAYFSWYSEGVVIVDFSDVRNPRKVAQFVPPPSPDPRGLFDLELGTPDNPHPAFPVVWGVYVSGRTVVASDINSGLWIFRLDRRSHGH